MRDLDWIYAVRDRVLADIRANPPRGPLLGEPAPRERKPCRYGHLDGRRDNGYCIGCDLERKRRRARKVAPGRSEGAVGGA